MKIIQVSAYYPPHLGGQENAVMSLSEQLAAAGHEVHVVTSDKGAENGAVDTGKVNVWRLGAREFGHAPIMPRLLPMLYRLATPGTMVHLHIGQAFTPEAVWLASKLRGIPYLAELHIDFQPSGPAGVLLPAYKRFVLGPVLRNAAVVAVLNDQTMHIARSRYGVTNRLAIVNNGIDQTFFDIARVPAGKATNAQRLLFVGRLTKQKNIVTLLEALSHLPRTVALDIAGDGPERSLVEKKISEYGLENVRLHGRVGRREIVELYKHCDVLVMPSLYEAQPLVLLEALAAGIPIIGSDVIGVGEHLQGCGIIVKPTTESLRRGLETFYATPQKELARMIARGKQKARTLSWYNLLPQYEALYKEALPR